MGQKASQEPKQENEADLLVICDVFSQGVVFASQKLKDYLGFEDPQSKFRPSTETLNEIFLVHFISFCVEKGVEERIATSKMTKQQSLLFGVDWVWTLSGSDKQVRLQIAVQSLQMANLPSDGVEVFSCDKEALFADERFRNKTSFEKLEEFCTLVGRDCLGLFVVFGVPGKPKDSRGVLLESIRREKRKNLLSGEKTLRRFVLDTNRFLPTREVLELCLSKKSGLKEVSNAYINFL